MKTTNNTKRIIKGLFAFSMALFLFACIGNVEVNAEEKSVLDLQSGDKLKAGDVLTYDGEMILDVIYGDSDNEVIEQGKDSITIKNSYSSTRFRGNTIINLGVDFVFENEQDGVKSVYVGLYGSLINGDCDHEWKVSKIEGYDDMHNVNCGKCSTWYYEDHVLENGVCNECETGVLAENPVAEAPVEEVVVEETVAEELVEEVIVEETAVEEGIAEQTSEEEAMVEELVTEEAPVEETEAKNNSGLIVGVVGVAVIAVGLYFGMKKIKK